MAKTDLQIQSFLTSNAYKSRTDWEMIISFCKDKAEIAPFNLEINEKNGMTASNFIDWYERGFGAGDIAEYDSTIVMIGKTDFKWATIVGKLQDDKILTEQTKVATDSLKMAPETSVYDFRSVMFRNRLQFSWKNYSVIEKYIPEINERVIFHGNGIKGLGVIREIDFISGEVELYCYYIYETKQCGYSMHEKGICNLSDFIFEPMDNGDKRQCKLNGISCQRRLNRELERYGKIWNQSRHRIEPIKLKVEVGKRYWYISDKMRVVTDVEKGLQTSHNRFLAGNYFVNIEHANDMLGQINEILRDYLASPKSNQQ